DQEVDERVHERTVGDGWHARRLGGGEGGVGPALQREKEVGEIDAAQQDAVRRHDDVVHERVHDGRERAADDHADREVEGVPAGDELPEVLQHGRSTLMAAWVAPPGAPPQGCVAIMDEHWNYYFASS